MSAAPPLIIGLTGRPRAGKSTVAALLEERFAFVTIAFADPILDMLGALAQHVDVDGAWLTEPALKEQPLPVLGRSYRVLAQSLGTYWGRAWAGDDFWISIAAHKLRRALEQGDNVCVSDVRFANEAAWLERTGGTLVRIERDGTAQPAGAVPHISEIEAAALNPSHTLTNNSTRAHLFDQVDTLITQLRFTQPPQP